MRASNSDILTADTLVYTGSCRIHALTVTFRLGAVGDFISIKDGTSVTGTTRLVVAAATASQTYHFTWASGKEIAFNAGLFLNVGAGANVYVEIVYSST